MKLCYHCINYKKHHLFGSDVLVFFLGRRSKKEDDNEK
ncbi:hypothetical protein B4155_4614 [Bacillus cereus]|nr:hypothetical protein B4155_4614 [Bacillus cereus]